MTMTNQVMNPRPVVVPTDDVAVKKLLRDLDEAATYFGEGPAERRERLARILVGLTEEQRLKLQPAQANNTLEVDKNQAFYYEGVEALREARLRIAEYSVQQSNYRLDMTRIKQFEPLATRLIPQQELVEKVRQLDDPESYVDESASSTELKTLTSCEFNPDGTFVCTSCRSGKCKLWSVPNMETHSVLRGHQQGANHITFNPKSGEVANELAPSVANLASCAMDGSINLWSLVDDTPVCQLSPVQTWRVTRLKYHPCGTYLASCCSDKSWRLWDLKKQIEILHQEGHSEDVFDIAFHPDGSLAGSASLDCHARVWDLRTGRSIQTLEGHSKGLRSIDFSPDGFHMATGSLDNTVKIWNLRQRKLEYTIPAHLGAVTCVVYEKENGFYLATSSFDKTVKFWSSETWAPIKTLDAYEDKVARIDVTTDSNNVISCYSKYVKLWTSKVSSSTTMMMDERI